MVDQVCVDQNERAAPEKNIQVALMGSIYGPARRMLIYLVPYLASLKHRVSTHATALRSLFVAV